MNTLRGALTFLLVSISLPSPAQTYTHRGFLEARGTFYPQKALNDHGRAIGESLFRYEGFYKPSAAFQFSGAVDLRADTHHQVARDFKLSWQDRESQRPLGKVRRLSALYHGGPVTLELGKQFVRWGKTDIVTPTDRFAPRDFLAVVDNDFLPVTAARLTLEKASNTVEVIWSPRLTPSRIPLQNQRWGVVPAVPAEVRLRDAGIAFPGGPQSGIRLNHVGSIEYGVSFYQGFNHLPSFDATLVPTPEGAIVDVRRFHPKMLMAGGDIVIPTRWVSLKGEAAHFSSTDERADEYALYVIQLERQSGEWFFIGGYAGEAVTRRGTRAADFAPDRGLTKTLLGRAGYTIDANRSVAFEAAVRQDGDGIWIKNEYSHAVGQHLRVTLGATIIGGSIDDFLGQYRRNSHATVVFRYSF
jgi:hypothetical protein